MTHARFGATAAYGLAQRARRGTAWALGFAAGGFAWPSLCLACAVCNDPTNQESQAAFVNMTIFLSLFPLALIGGLVLWLRHRIRLAEAQDAGGEGDVPHDRVDRGTA